MKFSVVTSFYNTSKYVEKLYASLLAQTYQNWEWVVTDDFSEDSSKEKLIKLSKQDSRVRYVEQQFKQEVYWNPHKYSSLNSDFVLHLGSDDTLNPKTLETYKHFFMTHSDVMCLISGGTRINEGGNWRNYIYGDVRHLNSADWRTKFGHTETMLITKAWRHIPFPTLDFNPQNKYQKRLEDLNILLRLEEIGKILCLHRNLSDITIRDSSLSNNVKLTPQNNTIVETTRKDILKDTDERRKGKSFYSIKKLFEDEFYFLNSFYYESLCKSSNHCIVNLLNPSISYRQQDVLKELYFDLEFRTHNFCPYTSHNYYIIQSEEDYQYLLNNKKDLLKYKNTIFCLLSAVYTKTINLREVLKSPYPSYYRGWNNEFWFQIFN